MNKYHDFKNTLEDCLANGGDVATLPEAFKNHFLNGLVLTDFLQIEDEIQALLAKYQPRLPVSVMEGFQQEIEDYKQVTQIYKNSSNSEYVTESSVSYYNTDGVKNEDFTKEQLHENMVIMESYRLVEQIGKGGGAVVWKAVDLTQEEGDASDEDKYVAIKFINQNSFSDKNIVKSVVREASRTRKLKHENIITVYEAKSMGGLYFIVMELLQGISLKQFIKDKRSVMRRSDPFISSYEECLHISQQITDAIAYAHQSDRHKKAVMHLDLKPENVFYDPKTRIIKVLDFGLSRYADKQDQDTTFFEGMGGFSVKYASPETLRRYKHDDDDDDRHDETEALKPDVEDDVYSLACVIYEVFAGRRPFDTLSSVQAERERKPIGMLDIKPHQWDALQKALAFDRNKRTATVQAFANEFFSEESEEPVSQDKPSKTKWGLVALLTLLIAGGSAAGLYQLFKNGGEIISSTALEKAQDKIDDAAASHQDRVKAFEQLSEADKQKLVAELVSANKTDILVRSYLNAYQEKFFTRLSAQGEELSNTLLDTGDNKTHIVNFFNREIKRLISEKKFFEAKSLLKTVTASFSHDGLYGEHYIGQDQPDGIIDEPITKTSGNASGDDKKSGNSGTLDALMNLGK